MVGKMAEAGKKWGDEAVRLQVDPGICGFVCDITANCENRMVHFTIQSDCRQIQKMAESLEPLGLKQFFIPLSKNPIFVAAESSKCHLACPVAWALVKAGEVSLGLALPKDAALQFMNDSA